MEIQDYLRQQNREQREELNKKDEIIKSLQKENYEVKQSMYNKLIDIRNTAQSNDMYKNIKILDKVEELIDDLYFDIQEELNEQLEKEYKKELISDGKSQN